MTTPISHRREARSHPLVWALGTSLVWFIAAAIRTETTLHLGPLLVPIVAASMTGDTDHPYRPALVGTAIGAAVIALLDATGNLAGPALEPFSSVLVESIVLLDIGGLIALVIAATRSGSH